jgi:tRNA(Ile)-lysidine synthase
MLRAAAPGEAQRLVGLACVCAGGAARLPASAARDRLAERLRGVESVTASLAGARVEADAAEVRIGREAGEARRGGLAPLSLPPVAPVVWDGRFEVTASVAGLELRPLAGLARRLPADQRRALASLPAWARGALPAVVAATGEVTSPLLGASPAGVVSLVGPRLRAAAGLVVREPD